MDDDKDTRTFLSEVLRACDAIVLESDNIAGAKAHASAHNLNLVVTDLAPPGEDGATFLKWLRQQSREQGGRIPAVVVTAFYEDHPLSEIPGWAAYFQKPVDINQFVDRSNDTEGAARPGDVELVNSTPETRNLAPRIRARLAQQGWWN